MTAPEPAPPYPTRFALDASTSLDRLRPLVQWFLEIPHWIVLQVLQSVGQVVAFVSWFIVLFTGKLPEGIANLQTMIMRYGMRVTAYGGFLYADYPPFDFASTTTDPGGSPIVVEVMPELEDRNRLTVFFRIILAIPVVFVGMILGIAAFFVWFAAFFVIIVTGGWPAGMRRFVERVLAYWLRVNAYVYLLTDRYPPLYLD